MKALHHDFHILTLESAFVIRTFFFVLFGMTVSLGVLLDLEVLVQGLVISVLLYVVRLVLLVVMKQEPLSPLLYIAPRGLITVLLFFASESQYAELVFDSFDQGVLLVVILTTSLVMTAALISHGSGIQPVADLDIGALPNAPRSEEDPAPSVSVPAEDGVNSEETTSRKTTDPPCNSSVRSAGPFGARPLN